MNTLHALELIGQFETAADERAIVTLLRELSGRMGFDYFRLALIFPSTIQRPDVIIFNGCPQAWVDTYTGSGFFAIDPIVKCAMTRSTPILWADVVNDDERCNEQGREVMQLASEYGIRDGITLPWHGANGHVGLLSFITSTPRTSQQWLSAVPFISWLSMHIFEAVARVCLAGQSPHDALSLRELEVCRWAAEGKQVSDIAQILGITPRTVTFHLNNVVNKLGGEQQEPGHLMGIETGDGQVERGDGAGGQCG
ncbi:LuxR family transcriptional regulator [Aeromonas dhakensis]|uniref:LuxR family transcriptional regulator n=1 Tax=Aeromonas dhakensis TaxID=196024 RepID=UPI00244116D4|nr:LuxR family transcriptional regulator [Aeromonas dhakensis]